MRACLALVLLAAAALAAAQSLVPTDVPQGVKARDTIGDANAPPPTPNLYAKIPENGVLAPTASREDLARSDYSVAGGAAEPVPENVPVPKAKAAPAPPPPKAAVAAPAVVRSSATAAAPAAALAALLVASALAALA